MMRRAHRVLLVEDSLDDAMLVELQLRRAGLEVQTERVDNEPDFEAALARGGWDIVLTDHAMPHFSSAAVLGILRERHPDLPCIIVSGRIGEEAAVAAMKGGASGYVGKDHLTQLEPAFLRALREAEDRRARRTAESQLDLLEKAVQDLQEGVLIATATGTPRVVYVNRGWCRMTGWEAQEVIGNTPATFGGPFADEVALAGVRDDPTARGAQGTTTVRRKDGAEFVLEWHVSPVRDASGQTTHIVSVQRDVTRRMRAEEALRVSEQRYALAAAGSNDGLWDWDLVKQEVFWSDRWKAMVGARPQEVGTSPSEWLDRVHPGDLAKVKAELQLHTEGVTPHFESEHRVRHADGGWRWMLVRGLAVRDAGKASRIAGSMTDITRHKETEERLAHGALHDALTGLPNRVLFMDRLWHSLGRVQRHASRFVAVLFIDLDRFKLVNDGLGHGVGDQLLIRIAHLLEECLRPGDTVARMGGDEFAMVLDDLREGAEATRVATRIQQALSKPFTIGGREVFTTASIGIALSGPEGAAPPEELLRDADTAMYRAKALGKARHVVFDAAMHESAVHLLQLETDLRRAVERHEFSVFYQPVVSLEKGHICGFESLVRWKHPDRGIVSPAEFVPLAEETGLIVPIGAQVLREACLQMREWQDRFRLQKAFSMGINLSGRQFADPALIDEIHDMLEEFGLDPRMLHMEITETVLIENAELAQQLLGRMHAMKIRVSLDDFGTGYSSLSYLHRFKVDTLKIDKSFVELMDTSEDNAQIVGTIAALANNLGMDVIAEGVETQAQARELWRMKCGRAQGYLFSKPLAPADVEHFLQEDHHFLVSEPA